MYVPSQQQLEALAAVVPCAQETARKFGVPASVTLAQWITESSWGTSQLATRCNNFFGIKSSQRTLPTSYMEFPTAEFESGKRVIVEALFMKYPSPQASFDGHGSLLAKSPRYVAAMKVAGNPAMFATQLQRCGYSTNPGYAAQLQEFIRMYHLNDYDVPPPGAPAAQEAA